MTERAPLTILYTFDADGLGLLSAIEFDATVSETHAQTATVTEHPVELRANVADHVRPGRDRLSVEACITNTPLTFVTEGTHPATVRNSLQPIQLAGYESRQSKVATVQGGKQAPFRPPLGIRTPTPNITVTPSEFQKSLRFATWNTLQTLSRIDRAKRVYQVLSELCKRGTILEVQTDLRYYDSMVILSLTTPRTVMDALVFGIEFVEFDFVETSTVTVTKRVAEVRAKPAVPAAPTPGETNSIFEDEEKLQSIANGITRALASGGE